MSPRRLLPLLCLVGAAAALAACDLSDADGATGRWAGTARFEADTILADHNVRIIADYETTFTFRLTDDEGLITGDLTARTTGYRIVREAGQPADTLFYDGEVPLVNDVFGTYIDRTLEVDVPDGPYEDNLWTFEVSGDRAEIDRFLVHTHDIPLADGSTFSFDIESTEFFEMERVSDEL